MKFQTVIAIGPVIANLGIAVKYYTLDANGFEPS
jgi:hypothetical protein